MPAYKRQRSECAQEETNVTSFVQSCINFKSNCTFHSVADAKKFEQAPTVLILGKESILTDEAAVKAAYPHYTAGVKAGIAAADASSAYVGCEASVESGRRILIGKVPDTASRHNCATRPDVIYTIIKAAISACPSATPNSPLDVYYVGKGQELSVSTAVARGSNRNFSAKKGNAEKSYLSEGRPVRVVFTAAKNLPALAHNALCTQLCQRLLDAPTNLLDTVTFTEIAVRWMEKLASGGRTATASVIKGEELRVKGYGGLYGVGKAAEYPPHLVTLSYSPKAGISPKEKIAFVGKGIVYDTGGLSIKPTAGMCTMKFDMGGAAAVFCGFLALALNDVPLQMSCILCLADNAVGPRSQRNDDIVRMKSGITVQINNTDAEGRLVLGDGVYHASAELSYTPNIIVDMATLTGAQGIATGKHHAGLYANTEGAEKRLTEAGRRSGDLCFPVVYCPEFHNANFKSPVADYTNSVSDRADAQVSCAGQFVGNHLSKEYKGDWAHVDIAFPAMRDQGTGFGVPLLVETFAGSLF